MNKNRTQLGIDPNDAAGRWLKAAEANAPKQKPQRKSQKQIALEARRTRLRAAIRRGQ